VKAGQILFWIGTSLAAIHALMWRLNGIGILLGEITPKPRVDATLMSAALIQVVLVIVMLVGGWRLRPRFLFVSGVAIVTMLSGYVAWWLIDVRRDLA
jgi:hypothetical protein